MASHCFRMCLLIENGVNNRDPHPKARARRRASTHTHTYFPAPSTLNKHTRLCLLFIFLVLSECEETMGTQQKLIIFKK